MDPSTLDLRTNTLAAALNMEYVKLDKDEVIISMPVNETTHQPAGLLHGGASMALAETAASIGGYLNVDIARQSVVGVEINGNHLRGKRDGTVTATALPLHLGRRTMVWEVKIRDEQNRLVNASRCTLAVINHEDV
ncbi:hotdog fold thioesterase [Alicyclobacillus sp. SO9]|uniref:hotdog fold thioesterase n=1 Tax=Alicyclobacillus sp. SO9 TaxID=2665646 RepID=UPI0018E73CF2|nr:hotdog fold thioesterase [Alicyclobacillus sp. SO9]QQE76943.1 hotdog fold thioesterase [Alicyclobacillus sp. SO9]